MKRNRKTTEWERLEISSKKLEVLRECLWKEGTIKVRSSMDLTEAEEIKKS